MTIAEAIYQHCLRLPEHTAREVLDFVEFLEHRCATAAPDAERESDRREALAHLAGIRIHWGGKPIADRDTLYDQTRS
jgi:hypothetical protein